MTKIFRIGIVLLIGVLTGGRPSSADQKGAEGKPELGKVTLKVEGMQCAGCVESIQSALLKVPGVKAAQVNLEQGKALVTFQRGKVTSERLIKAVGDASNREFQYKASVVPESLTLKVEGIQGPPCVKAIRSALLKRHGVCRAEVSLEKGEACVQFDPTLASPDELIKEVEGASKPGFSYKASLAPEKVVLRIEGMTCCGRAAEVRSVLLNVPGVKAVEVSLEKGEAIVAFERGKVTSTQLTEAVRKAGYKVSVAGK